MREALRIDVGEAGPRCDAGAVVFPALPPRVRDVLGRLATGGADEAPPLSPDELFALEEAFRAVGPAEMVDAAAPGSFELTFAAPGLACLPWEALLPRGGAVVRRAGGTAWPVAVQTPLRLATTERATLPDAVRTAHVYGGAWRQVLTVAAWPAAGADVVQARAGEVPAAVALLPALRAAGVALLVLEAYSAAERARGRLLGYALVAGGLPAALVVEDPAGVDELWSAAGAPLPGGLVAGGWRRGTLTAAPGFAGLGRGA